MKKAFKILPKVFDTIMILLLVLVLSVSALYFASAIKNKSSFPNVFGYTPLIVVSGSMEPVIKINDIVIVKKAHYSELEVGDIIVYHDRARDMTIIHRLMEIDNGRAITKGDANFSADVPFSVSQIYGKKVLTIPYIGQFVAYIKTHLFASCLCVGVLVTYLTTSIFMRKKKKQREDITI